MAIIHIVTNDDIHGLDWQQKNIIEIILDDDGRTAGIYAVFDSFTGDIFILISNIAKHYKTEKAITEKLSYSLIHELLHKFNSLKEEITHGLTMFLLGDNFEKYTTMNIGKGYLTKLKKLNPIIEIK